MNILIYLNIFAYCLITIEAFLFDLSLGFHFAGIHRVYVPKKNNKLIVFFNNKDIVSFKESCCGQSTAIQNEANREAVGKKSTTTKTK